MTGKATTIYALVESDTGRIRYVGKTTQPLADRLCGHRSDKRKTLRASWIKSVVARGAHIVIVALETLPAGADWQSAERRWIALHRAAGARLVNGTAGGEGLHDPSVEVRAKLRLNRLGKKMPAEVVARHREMMTGRKRTPEQRARMSEAARKRGISAENRAKLNASLKGRRFSDEACRNIGLAAKGRTKTAEQRAAMSEAAKKRGVSPAAVARMTETKRRQALDPDWRAKQALNFSGIARLGKARS